MYWEYTYILFIIGVVVSGIASWNVNRTFRNFSKFPNGRGLVAEEVAALIMQKAGIFDVRIERVKGSLTDHYSAKDNVLRLSDSVFGSTSVAAIGVAAHESGHAIQHKVGYLPLKLRSASVPVANFGTMVSWPIILVGLIFGWMGIAQIGVFLFFFVVLFQIITLPVEFNASSRALQVLGESKILIDGELEGAAKVLRAAALTYVAALFTSILQLLRLILITKGSSRMR